MFISSPWADAAHAFLNQNRPSAFRPSRPPENKSLSKPTQSPTPSNGEGHSSVFNVLSFVKIKSRQISWTEFVVANKKKISGQLI